MIAIVGGYVGRSVTAEILLTLSLCGWVGGWWSKVIFVSNPTFELSCG